MAKRKVSENSLKNLELGNLANKTPSERKEIARKGAAITNAKIAERKTLAELMKVALSLPNEETGEINEIAITNAIINKAAKGDVSAYQTIRDTIGEKPTDKQEAIVKVKDFKYNKEQMKEIIDDINTLADE